MFLTMLVMVGMAACIGFLKESVDVLNGKKQWGK